MKLAWNRRRFYEKVAFGAINTDFYVTFTDNKTRSHN
jgi:hypothetical protein